MLEINKHSAALFLMQVVAHGVLLSMLFWASWSYWLLTGLGYFLFSCIGTSIGYHRLFGHRSFESPPWFELLCLCLGNLALVGSSISWTATHRAHHRYSDQTSLDPHSPHHHKWYDVIFLAMFQPVNVIYAKDLLRRPSHAWWHKWYFQVHLVLWIVGLLLFPTWFCALIIAPQALTWTMGATLNWFNHKWGYRSHNTADHSTNNWFYAIFYWGEGWHNNHHANPKKFSFGERWWEIDVAGAVIKMVTSMDDPQR